MTTYTFDFQRIADGLTVQVRIRDAHKQELCRQMLERYERSGGKAGMSTSMRIAAMVLISVGLVGTVILIKGVRTQESGFTSSPGLIGVQQCVDNHDIPGLITFLDHDLDEVQIRAIQSLGQIGNAAALAALLTLLDTEPAGPVRAAALAAVEQLRQRLAEPSRPAALVSPVPLAEQQAPVSASSIPVPASARTLRLKILDADTQAPIRAADVDIRYWPHRSHAISDANGYCEIILSDDMLDSLRVSVFQSGYAGKTLYWAPGETGIAIPSDYRVSLEQGMTVSGRVETPEGIPLAGVRVTFNLGLELQTEEPALENNQTTTDANGLWSIEDVPTRLPQTSITLERSDYSQSRFYDAGTLMDSLTARECVLRMQPALTLGGQVLDGNEQPIAGAEVRYHAHLLSDPMHTDAQGTFAFTSCPPEKASLSILAPGHAPYLRILDVNDRCSDLTYILQPGESLAFEVVDTQGLPVPGAWVKAEQWRKISSFQRTNCLRSSAQTDGRGRAVLHDLPGDTVLYSIRKEGYATADYHAAQSSDGEQRIILWPAGELIGYVFNARTGEPVSEFSLIRGPQWPDRDTPVWQTHAPRRYQEGRFELPLDQQNTGLAVRIAAPGFVTHDSEPFYNQGVLQEYEVYLAPVDSEPFNGIVIDPHGLPVSKAMVVISSSRRPARMLQGRAQVEAGEIYTQTSQEGRFTLPIPNEVQGILVVSDAGVAGVRMNTFPPAASVQLTPWGYIEGTVTRNGRPVPGQSLFLSVRDPITGGQGTSYRYECRTDLQGYFSFDRVIPGDVTVFRWTEAGQGPGSRLELEPGQSQFVEIEIEGPHNVLELYGDAPIIDAK